LIWNHIQSGKRYKLISVALAEDDLTPVICYREWDGKDFVGPVWVRNAEEFLDGRFRTGASI
jgi:hypothetical protein